jgi:putative cardiolipin synthase
MGPVLLIRVALIVLAAAIAGCAVQPFPFEDVPRAPSFAEIEPGATSLGREAAALALGRERESGFLVLDRGEEALLWRGALAERAERTIDAQYYIWSEDNVGTIAAERLLRAAERGVRVRVLVDDLPISTDPRFLAMLDAHARVEIRVYNPGGYVGRASVSKALAFLGEFQRMNRRMHNKALIVDGAVAVIGGRNVADEYYDMHREYNFRDRDVLAVGPVVAQAAQAFDRYWNSVWAVPVEALLEWRAGDAEREAYYAQLHAYADDPAHFPERFHEALAQTRQRLGDPRDALAWGEARLVYDVPGKNDDPASMNAYGEMGRQLTELVSGARAEVLAETPYLAMMPGTLALASELRSRGVRVRILTNSLASTDAAFAFSRYVGQRGELLALGLELHEWMPHPADYPEIVPRLHRMAKPARLGLHAKSMVIDRSVAFIGSFNMDPRSTHLNTEMGVLVRSPDLAARLAASIERDMEPRNSWKVALGPGGTIEWTGERDGRSVTTDGEPDATASALMMLFLLSLLPIGDLI